MKQAREALLALSRREKQILHQILIHKAISRPELLRRSRLKAATLYRSNDALVEAGMVLVQKDEGAANVGRPSDLLCPNPSFAYIFSISVQRLYYHTALIDFAGNIVWEESHACDESVLPQQIVDTCWEQYQMILRRQEIPESRVLGVSLSTFGMPLYNHASIRYPRQPYYPGFAWGEYDSAAKIEAKFSLPTWFEYNARSAAWGSYLYRYVDQSDSLAYIFINEGLGTSALVGGQVVRGGQRIINGLGHMVIDVDGEQCACGKYGCVETKVSTTAIETAFAREMKLGKASVLSQQKGVGYKEICAAAQQGDAVSAYIIEDSASMFAVGLENFLNLLDINLVIVGGIIPVASPLFVETVRQRLYTRLPKIRIETESNENAILLQGCAAAYLLHLLR